MAEDPAALMRQLHDEHAAALWRFCLRLVGNDRGRAEDVVQEGGTDGDETDQLLLSWVVSEALTRLSSEHRAVLLECYYRGRPVAEAARRLGIPEGTVKSRTHYALRALRLALEEMGVSA